MDGGPEILIAVLLSDGKKIIIFSVCFFNIQIKFMGNSEFIPCWLLWENKTFGLLPKSLEAVYREVHRQQGDAVRPSESQEEPHSSALLSR